MIKIGRLQLPFNDLLSRTVLNCKRCCIDFYSDSLEYSVVASYTSEDEKDGLVKESKIEEQSCYSRTSIEGMCSFWDNDEQQYAFQVNMEDRNFCWFFGNDKGEANRVYRIFKQYKLNLKSNSIPELNGAIATEVE